MLAAALLVIIPLLALGAGALVTLVGAVLIVAAPSDSGFGFPPPTIGAAGVVAGLALFTAAACALLEQLRP